jgi:multimeric flavodoxin WrbA
MKIITLLGSAKKKGNTATVLGWVEEELTRRGHQIERVYLNAKSINGCLGCAKCRQFPDEVACVQSDDAPDILERMIAAEAALFASPIYFWGFSAQIKALIDRGYSLVTNYHQPGHTSLLEGQRQALLVTGADGYQNKAEPVFTAFDRMVEFYKATKAGELYVEHCTTPSKMDPQVESQAVALARQLVA